MLETNAADRAGADYDAGGRAMARPAPWRRRLLLGAFLFFLAASVFALAQILFGLYEYAASDSEYQYLRNAYAPASPAAPAAGRGAEAAVDPGVDSGAAPPASTPEAAGAADAAPPPADAPQDPAAVNPDYVGWMRVAGTGIDYPVVRGGDNDKYLSASFWGRPSRLGAIFMDWRCLEGFAARHTIIYGHNARNGAMFGALRKFLDPVYLEAHGEITLSTDGGALTYTIFAARESDIHDPAYRLSFASEAAFADFAASLGAPYGTERILTLSTCSDGEGKDGRLLLHAAPAPEQPPQPPQAPAPAPAPAENP